jgi:hypothetical protein
MLKINNMKNFILLILIITLLSCDNTKEIYKSDIKTYTISHKEEIFGAYNARTYYIYFQTSTSTERATVTYNTYSKYNVGDTIQVLIKYWEKPKKE